MRRFLQYRVRLTREQTGPVLERKEGAKSGCEVWAYEPGFGRKKLSMTRALPEEDGHLCLKATE